MSNARSEVQHRSVSMLSPLSFSSVSGNVALPTHPTSPSSFYGFLSYYPVSFYIVSTFSSSGSFFVYHEPSKDFFPLLSFLSFDSDGSSVVSLASPSINWIRSDLLSIIKNDSNRLAKKKSKEGADDLTFGSLYSLLLSTFCFCVGPWSFFLCQPEIKNLKKIKVRNHVTAGAQWVALEDEKN